MHATKGYLKLDVSEEQTEYQQDIAALKAKERFSGVAPSTTTEEDEFLAQLLVHFSNGTRARKRSFSDDSNDEEIPLQVESRRKVVKVKRNGGLKDVRLPNACEEHKRRHLKCPLDCPGRRECTTEQIRKKQRAHSGDDSDYE